MEHWTKLVESVSKDTRKEQNEKERFRHRYLTQQKKKQRKEHKRPEKNILYVIVWCFEILFSLNVSGNLFKLLKSGFFPLQLFVQI